jgi:hypothetical protein
MLRLGCNYARGKDRIADTSCIGQTWKQYFESALEELDLAKTEENVQFAEELLFLRRQELAGNPNHHGERTEMKQASASFLRVKTLRLGWPGIES